MKAYENKLKHLQDQGIDTSDMKPTSQPYKYRSKEEDPELYIKMNDAFEPWSQPVRLTESLHGESTQINEALNQAVAKYIPKQKHTEPLCHFKTKLPLQLVSTITDTKIFCSCLPRAWDDYEDSIIPTPAKKGFVN